MLPTQFVTSILATGSPFAGHAAANAFRALASNPSNYAGLAKETYFLGLALELGGIEQAAGLKQAAKELARKALERSQFDQRPQEHPKFVIPGILADIPTWQLKRVEQVSSFFSPGDVKGTSILVGDLAFGMKSPSAALPVFKVPPSWEERGYFDFQVSVLNSTTHHRALFLAPEWQHVWLVGAITAFQVFRHGQLLPHHLIAALTTIVSLAKEWEVETSGSFESLALLYELVDSSGPREVMVEEADQVQTALENKKIVFWRGFQPATLYRNINGSIGSVPLWGSRVGITFAHSLEAMVREMGGDGTFAIFDPEKMAELLQLPLPS